MKCFEYLNGDFQLQIELTSYSIDGSIVVFLLLEN